MDILTQLILIVGGFLSFSVGIGFFLKRPDSTQVRAFSLFAIFIAFWILSIQLYFSSNDSSWSLLGGRLAFFFSALIAYACYRFGLVFPRRTYTFSVIVSVLVVFETIALCAVALATDYIFSEVWLSQGDVKAAQGPMYYWFVAHLLILFSFGVAFIYYKTRRLAGREKEQSAILLYGLVISIFFGVLTNVVLSRIFGIDGASRFGPAAAFPVMIGAGIAVAKHELFNVKIILAEILVTSVILVLVMAMYISPDFVTRGTVGLAALLTGVIGFLLIHHVRKEVDRSEQLAVLNRELTAANAQLTEMDEIKNEFITMASHQLRTPISVVKGYLSLMLEGAYGVVPDAIKDKLQQIFSLNDRLVQMIDNMLNASRIEKRKIDYSMVKVDVVDVVRKVVEEMGIKAKEKSLTLAANHPPRPVMAFIDEEKMLEVVSNLIDNAIKYTDEGEVSVTVREDEGDGFVTVLVKDSGIGMSREEASRVFTKFFRAKEAVIREPGTGLGLFICAKFVQGMGGQIGVVETAPNEGTTFAVRVPVHKADGFVA
jgi:signal transduction histidine kinase